MEANKQSWNNQERRDQLLRNKRQLEDQIQEQEATIEGASRKIEEIDSQLKQLRQRFFEVFETKFEPDPEEAVCPTCKRPVDNIEEKREKMQEEFNWDKSQKIESIKADGKPKYTPEIIPAH